VPKVLGAVYIFRRNKFGAFVVNKRLQYDGAVPGGNLEIQFGWEVKVSGDNIAVGSPRVARPCAGTSGTIELYRRNGEDWVREDQLRAPTSSDIFFGYHLDLSNDSLVAGYLPVCGNPDRQGHAIVYTRKRSGNGFIAWLPEETLTSPSPPPAPSYDAFGTAVTISGDMVAVGGATALTGVLVYKRNGNHWDFMETIPRPAPDSTASGFGTEISMSGDRMIIGAHAAGPTEREAFGAVFIYEFDGTSWKIKQRLVPDDPIFHQNFGQTVCIAGNRALIGVSRDINNFAYDAGAVYVFDRGDDGVWKQTQKIIPSDPHAGAVFGQSVATNGSKIAVGAPWHGVGGRWFGQGQAYVYGLDNDLDGDGLSDEMELHGYVLNGQFVDLKRMGANPLHKDIFIHADWLLGRKPDPRAIQMVVDAFAKAPKLNPDGKNGITLHIDLGPDSKMTPKKTWGKDLSKAHEFPFQAIVGTINQDSVYEWNEVDQFKRDFEATGRAVAFHYILFSN
jgi:hypothetical protein